MFDRYNSAEELILAMADIVKEVRALRKAVSELELEREKYKAYFYGQSEKAEILSDIECHNASVEACNARGWITSSEYIENWEEELSRRMANNKSCI